tara:strand:+ start:1869 stop:2636 length:768 start_codon:yes stop_codon:yes gene_type:complete
MINKKRYALARDRSCKIEDQDKTIDKFVTDRFIDIILEQKKVFHKVLIIGDKNNFTENRLNLIGIKDVTHINISKDNNSEKIFYLPDSEAINNHDSYDLIIGLSLVNFLNDIPNFLKQLKTLLLPEGLMLHNFFSENNLLELKEMFSTVELEVYNGISQRFMPVIDIRDIGDLINNIGFSDTVISRENLKYFYSSFKEMISHLRLMVCTNFLKTKENKYINKNFMNNLIIFFEKRKIDKLFKLNFDILIVSSWKK